MKTDKELLEIYYKGFGDELGVRIFNNTYEKNSLEYKAYELGGAHAFYGDDCSSFDNISKEEILKIIRNA